jgi:multiple sugar transport system permease protein
VFDNIRDVFTLDGGDYLRWMRNTVLYSLISAVGGALLAAAAGYGFAKFEFRGKNAMFWLVLGSIMVPQTALAIPTYLMFSKIGLTNSPLAVILPSLVSPFGIYLMRIYVQEAVPSTLIEAARIDGAGEFRIFRAIAFRLLAPGFVTVLLFTFVATWNNYFLPLVMLSEPRWYPVTVGLSQWNSQAKAGGGSEVLFSLVITGALIAVVPLIAGSCCFSATRTPGSRPAASSSELAAQGATGARATAYVLRRCRRPPATAATRLSHGDSLEVATGPMVRQL